MRFISCSKIPNLNSNAFLLLVLFLRGSYRVTGTVNGTEMDTLSLYTWGIFL